MAHSPLLLRVTPDAAAHCQPDDQVSIQSKQTTDLVLQLERSGKGMFCSNTTCAVSLGAPCSAFWQCAYSVKQAWQHTCILQRYRPYADSACMVGRSTAQHGIAQHWHSTAPAPAQLSSYAAKDKTGQCKQLWAQDSTNHAFANISLVG